MLLQRFYDDKLAQASYLLACQATGEALIVDPNRDVEQYITAADAEGVRITYITETHIHADFVSGSRELAQRTGARLLLSDEGGVAWRYEFAAADDAQLLRDADRFSVGRIELRVMHTPGHTPEHLAFVVTDTPTTSRPMGVFTGDFLFAGDVGRPDLLERAVRMQGTMEASARSLFRSIRRFAELPDYLQLWPGHGAGSACGKSLGAVPTTTLGYEKIANWAFGIADEGAFVREVLGGQPEPPGYFAEMKRINRTGPRVLHGRQRPERLPGSAVVELVDAGALIVDTRPAAAFADGHIPGMLNVPLNRSFTTWMGWLVPYDREFHLLIDDHQPELVDEAVRDLSMIGLDRIAGYVGLDALDAWTHAGRESRTVPQIGPSELASRLHEGDVAVLDVRGRAEWEAGHLPGVPNIPVGHLRERLSEIPRDRPLVVQCQSGARSSIAASVLLSAGLGDVANLRGGFAEWERTGYAVMREGTAPASSA